MKGKDKCNFLKLVRKDIAERYGLNYTSSECTYEGDCSGTCPKCDAELKELQEQLDARGIKDVDFMHDIVDVRPDNIEVHTLQGDISNFSDDRQGLIVEEGLPMPSNLLMRKKRVLYKECQIAGITFHDLQDIWDELYEGAELALIRHKNNKYDKNAIAVALADDYDGDPDDFDFDYILGYVPRSENEYLATMMDLGWAEAFECELSQVNGSNPYKGSLHMKIYMVSKEEEVISDTSNLIRVLELDDSKYQEFLSDLDNKGCTYFRLGGFPPWEHKFPQKGEKVVFMYREEDSTVLYLMHCIAVGDEDASYFVEDKESLHAVDDSCYYVFTNCRGPIIVQNEELDFLDGEPINKKEPEEYLSEEASEMIKNLIDNYK